MKIKFIKPRADIAPLIDIFWSFESPAGLPENDSRMIVPNGTAKMIIPLRNSLVTGSTLNEVEAKEEKIHITGLWDKPTIIKSEARFTSTIGISLTTTGASQLLPFPMKELKNTVFSFDEIFGNYGKQIQEQLANTESVEQKLDLIQTTIGQLAKQTNNKNQIVTYCVREIKKANGLIKIKELEKKTGYTKRHLDMLFNDNIGLSPKLLSDITRFNMFYNSWAKHNELNFYKGLLYEYYYDQSHFIKEFKRFSGYTPKQIDKISNDFGKLFV